MTSERTPQDVLRELAQVLAMPDDGMVRIAAIRPMLVALDKAIAEAPDSPHALTGQDIRAAIGRASSLTNPRLSEIEWDDVAAELPAPDTLLEKPGLDVERLREAIYAVSGRHDWEHIIDREDRTDEIAEFYARLGSTDSEGR